MKKHHYLKRLDRIQDGLHLPVGDKDTVMFFTMFGLPNCETAISRGRKAGCTSVVFVPANGSAVQFATCDQADHVTPGVAVAYEIAEPGCADSNQPLAYCTTKQLRQLAAFYEAAPDAVAGGNESVSLVRGGEVDFKAFISPEELP